MTRVECVHVCDQECLSWEVTWNWDLRDKEEQTQENFRKEHSNQWKSNRKSTWRTERRSPWLVLSDGGLVLPDKVKKLGRVRPTKQRSKWEAEKRGEISLTKWPKPHLSTFGFKSLLFSLPNSETLGKLLNFLSLISISVSRMGVILSTPHKSSDCWTRQWM